MAFLIFNPMKYLNLILIILPMFFSSCSCDKEEDEDIPNTPAWVSKQFYLALADEAYYDAMEYCDKSTKRKLENDYSFQFNMPKITFVKVDSCDQFEDHAYCYCRYRKEDSTENTHKLLLRNFDQLWKVHYDMDTSDIGESRLYSDRIVEMDNYSPTSIQLTGEIVYELDSILNESIRIMNNSEFVVGFFSGQDVHTVCVEASKESSYDEFYIKRTYLDEVEASTTFHFDGDNKLSEFDVVLLDLFGDLVEASYQYLIEGLIKEYGTPYNAKNIQVEHLYRYKEIKWFLQGFNEELIISNEYQNPTITLKKAY